MNEILNSNFFEAGFTIIIQVLTVLTNIILLPFNILLGSFMPGFDDQITKITEVFDMVGNYVGWGISALGIPPLILSLVLTFFTITVFISISIWGSKLLIKWVGHFV